MSRQTDPLAVARSIIADPHKRYTVSMLDIIALCKALVATDEAPTPVISTELAQAIATVIGDDALGDLNGSLSTLKTLFETEFPDVCHD